MTEFHKTTVLISVVAEAPRIRPKMKYQIKKIENHENDDNDDNDIIIIIINGNIVCSLVYIG